MMETAPEHTVPSDAFVTYPVTPRLLACFLVKDLDGWSKWGFPRAEIGLPEVHTWPRLD